MPIAHYQVTIKQFVLPERPETITYNVKAESEYDALEKAKQEAIRLKHFDSMLEIETDTRWKNRTIRTR